MNTADVVRLDYQLRKRSPTYPTYVADKVF